MRRRYLLILRKLSKSLTTTTHKLRGTITKHWCQLTVSKDPQWKHRVSETCAVVVSTTTQVPYISLYIYIETCVVKSQDDDCGSVFHKKNYIRTILVTYLAGIYTNTDIDRITSSQLLSRSHFRTK